MVVATVSNDQAYAEEVAANLGNRLLDIMDRLNTRILEEDVISWESGLLGFASSIIALIEDAKRAFHIGNAERLAADLAHIDVLLRQWDNWTR